MKNKKLFAFFKKSAALFMALCLTFAFSACENKKDYYQKQDFIMDTVLTQKIYGVENGEEIAGQALSYVNGCDRKFSSFLENSEIYLVNSSGKETEVSKETAELVMRSLEFSKKSQNGFAVSIFPLSSIWKKAIDEAKLPKKQDVTAASLLVNDESVLVNTEKPSITLQNGAKLDLGAIAKGYAVDGIKKIYEKNKVTGAICSLGSSAILLYGTKPDGSDFKIGVRDPFDEQKGNLLILSLSSCALSTSGGYERFTEIDGKQYHHIIDPKTGYPAESDLACVTVVGQDGAELDYLSTELFLAGFEKAKEMAVEQGLSVVLATNDKKLFISKDLEDKVSSVSKQYKRVYAQ